MTTKTKLNKWIISLWSSLFFTLYIFCVSRLNLGIKLQSDKYPSLTILILHTIIFTIFIRIVMLIPLPGIKH